MIIDYTVDTLITVVCEKELIAKECTLTHMCSNFAFNELYTSAHQQLSVLKAVQSCFKLRLLPQHYEPVFFVKRFTTLPL